MSDAVIVDELVVPESSPIHERVVVAPCGGHFHPLPPEVFTSEGEWVEPGTVLAEIRSGERVEPVRSRFRGWVMGMLAFPGHAVQKGEGLFWIRGS